MSYNRELFFKYYRDAFGPLNQEQVDGLEFLLAKLESDNFTLNQQSYILATIDHETAHTFQPIKERRERTDSPGRGNQDRYWKSGYYGRGYVQLTWKKNYEKFGIVDDPDKALEPEMAYEIIAQGMRDGLFTGRKLSDYIDGEVDFVRARKIVNGMDRADEIAARARKYVYILAKSSEVVPGAPAPEPKPEPPVVTVPSHPPVVEVKPPSGSLSSKVASVTAAVTPILTATGLKIGGVQFSVSGLIALFAMITMGMIVGAVLWDRDRQRQLQRQLASMNNLADKERRNVVAGQAS